MTSTGKGKHRKQHISCVLVSSSVRFVSIEISRGKLTYAVGSAIVHRGRTSMRMHSLRTLRRGRYLVTVVEAIGKNAVVVRYTTRL